MVMQQIRAHYSIEYSGLINCDQIKVRYQLINQLWLGNNRLCICCQVTALILSQFFTIALCKFLCALIILNSYFSSSTVF